MLSKTRLNKWQGVFRLPDKTIEVVSYQTYESERALYDIITRDNGEVLYQKNSRIITNIEPADKKYYDFIRGC